MNGHLIDDVARRMTDVAPPAELRARIVARLGDRPAPWRAWMPLAAAAAIVTAIVGVSVARPAPPRRTSTPLAALSQTTAGNLPAAALIPANNTAMPIKPIRKKRPARPEAISAAEAAWRARAIPAIAALAPLTTDEIQPESLTVPLLELKPLVTLPVIVAPIDADASGGR
ncbi:MAG TPA: hypothetical protein VFV98_03545 [Vicinamibacterales bacterium]|nr:hypothetical protein [Vicinamibacterales bacterium]